MRTLKRFFSGFPPFQWFLWWIVVHEVTDYLRSYFWDAIAYLFDYLRDAAIAYLLDYFLDALVLLLLCF